MVGGVSNLTNPEGYRAGVLAYIQLRAHEVKYSVPTFVATEWALSFRSPCLCPWHRLVCFLLASHDRDVHTYLRLSLVQSTPTPRQERGFGNVRVITGDINEFDLGGDDKGTFDRVMSIEMFEHMKNYKLLIAKISGWLAPGGKLFGGLRMECAAIDGGDFCIKISTIRVLCIYRKKSAVGEEVARRR